MLAGRYIILRKIAQGGMGAVYEAASQASGGPSLAIKEMSLSALQKLEAEEKQLAIESFHREFELLRTLSHPNLVQAYEYFHYQGRDYFVMEYLDGQTLECINENSPTGQFIPTERVLEWARQLCDVLDYLHHQTPPIIYRDLKPSNVIELAGTNVVKLFDFGIARFYKPGKPGDTITFGTLGYLAPEAAARKAQSSAQTDVFALGVVLHEMLTRCDPTQHLYTFPAITSINSKVPARVVRAIDSALEMDVSKRLPSAEALLKGLFGKEAKFERPAQALGPPVPLPPAPPAPAPKPPPGAAHPAHPKPAQAIIVQPMSMQLSPVRRGETSYGKMVVTLPPNTAGQVRSESAWISVQPVRLGAGTTSLALVARSDSLPAGTKQPLRPPPRLAKLPRILQRWVEVHANSLVPFSMRYDGHLVIEVPGHPNRSLPVELEVNPTQSREKAGWAAVYGFLLVEILLLVGAILLILSELM
jgi:serine/threonine protein kinase